MVSGCVNVLNGGVVAGTDDLLVFHGPAQIRTTPGRLGSILFEGTFRIWQRAAGGFRVGLYCDVRRYPILGSDGKLVPIFEPPPLIILKGHSFRCFVFPGRTYLRFPNDGDAEKVARLSAGKP